MLQRKIPPEIFGDVFHRDLQQLAGSHELQTFLEIGSSSGEGSTNALVTGIRERPDRADVRLFCVEVSRERADTLRNHYENDTFVRCYNVSSIPSSDFPSAEELFHFFHKVRNPFNLKKARHKYETACKEIEADLCYLREQGTDGHGIRLIKEENGIRHFDFVLIDGSEFAGERELLEVLGAKVIALDDIRTFKCWTAHQLLKAHPGYRLFRQSKRTRNGYSIFKRQF